VLAVVQVPVHALPATLSVVVKEALPPPSLDDASLELRSRRGVAVHVYTRVGVAEARELAGGEGGPSTLEREEDANAAPRGEPPAPVRSAGSEGARDEMPNAKQPGSAAVGTPGSMGDANSMDVCASEQVFTPLPPRRIGMAAALAHTGDRGELAMNAGETGGHPGEAAALAAVVLAFRTQVLRVAQARPVAVCSSGALAEVAAKRLVDVTVDTDDGVCP